jgi:N-acetylneuraminate synthase
MIEAFRAEFGCAVGLSDHSGTIFPSLAAATIGVEVLELHVTLSREMFGPDVCASVTTAELKTVVDGVRYIERVRENPVDKNQVPASVKSIRGIFMKSVVARTDLAAGTLLSPANLTVKKPGGGLPAARLPELSGRRLRHAVRGDQPISIYDLE